MNRCRERPRFRTREPTGSATAASLVLKSGPDGTDLRARQRQTATPSGRQVSCGLSMGCADSGVSQLHGLICWECTKYFAGRTRDCVSLGSFRRWEDCPSLTPLGVFLQRQSPPRGVAASLKRLALEVEGIWVALEVGGTHLSHLPTRSIVRNYSGGEKRAVGVCVTAALSSKPPGQGA